FLFERLVFGSIERATVMRWGMVRTAKGEDSYDRPITTGLWEYGSPLSRGRQLGETHETLLLGYSRRPCHRRELVDRRRPGLSRSPGDDHRAVRARRLRRYRRPPLRAKTAAPAPERWSALRPSRGLRPTDTRCCWAAVRRSPTMSRFIRRCRTIRSKISCRSHT